MLKKTPDYIQKQKRSFEDLKQIVKDLRSEDGCSWDRAQTNISLKTCMLEEAAEAVSGISLLEQTGNPDNLREELGDVLLQVILHCQIAEEMGYFSLDEVIEQVSIKMIRRHPHVYGNASYCAREGMKPEKFDPDKEYPKTWDEIKELEKRSRTWEESPMKKQNRKEMVAQLVNRL